MRTADTRETKRNHRSDAGEKSGRIRTEAGTLRERWRSCVERELAAIEGNGAFAPAAIIEEAEGRPLADVITDSICRQRGCGVADPTADQSYRRQVDAWYESRATDRARRSHMAETASQETFRCMMMPAPLHRGLMTDAQLRTFVSRFYRRGDCGLGPAIGRALLASVRENTSERPITFNDDQNAVTIRISGKAFENLREISAIFNKWDEADNTPADIARRFLCSSDDWLCLDEKKPDENSFPQTLAGMICDAFDECDDMHELETAFKAAGFSVWR